MKKISSNFNLLTTALLCILLSSCGGGGGGGSSAAPPPSPQEPEDPYYSIQHLSAGDATVFETQSSAFSKESPNITDTVSESQFDRLLRFNIGDDFFERPWVSSRASTQSRDGLGPHFNNNACQNCHINDGRGHAANVSENEDGTDFSTMLIRAVRTDISAQQRQDMLAGKLANVPDSSVGSQLQNRSNLGIQHEADQRVSYTTQTITFNDGHSVELRKPIWHLSSTYAPNYDFNQDTIFSARVAQPMIGLGMLAEIKSSDILAKQDINDANNDGISGKANFVWVEEEQAVKLGRFGWKAGQPSIRQQSAMAFLQDMGLTSEIFQEDKENCLPHQADCLNQQNGNGDQNEYYPYEVPTKILKNITFYASNLAVPARRNAYSKPVLRGKDLFKSMGCNSCHVEVYKTQKNTVNIEQSEQIIFPYTDLLLHDMGEDLADFTQDNEAVAANVLVEFKANAREWRTPPLWGIGLSHVVDPKASFLHDGRARTLMEAVLWHGGEAQAAKEKVLALNAQQRDDLMAFLNSL